MNQELTTAVETIKTAILQSQYQIAKDVTRVFSLFFRNATIIFIEL